MKVIATTEKRIVSAVMMVCCVLSVGGFFISAVAAAGPVYDPAEFTVTASGPGISPEDLFESVNATFNNYTTQFGKAVAPVALADSSLSPDYLNLRKTLSVDAASVPPLNAGYLGVPSMLSAPAGNTLAAYGFLVTPLGQTMTYTYTVAGDADNAAYTAAEEGLQEWLAETNSTVNAISGSIVDHAVCSSSELQGPGLIGSQVDETDYKKYGKVKLISKWYWDPYEQDRDQDYFFTQSILKMTPGLVSHGNGYRNHQFVLTIDPGYSDLSGKAPHLPDASGNEYAPTATTSGKSVTCSLATNLVGLSWTTDTPDTSLKVGNPRGELHEWTGTFERGGNLAGNTFSLTAGLSITCWQPDARNGNTYTISKNSVDAYHAFDGGVLSPSGPTTERYIPHKQYVVWKDSSYIKI